MMKNVLKTMAAVMLLVGCHKETTGGRATVRVNVNDFSISQQDFPGAKTSPASYSGVKAMTLAPRASTRRPAWPPTATA